ncbi:ABC transporter related (fragment) [uncultured Desulfobacterium sp.]|uniref:ABC transporter related n=1 Tax=uncultured Desulfobacterium sp. TaxID=201089 RepID=A0A445MYE1_9BACT
MNQPEILILDEPTIGLDPEQVSEIRRVIKGLSGERTVILSSHILSEVSMICSKVIILNRGQVLAVDTPQNLSRLLQETMVTNARIEGPREEILIRLENVSGVLKIDCRDKISENVFTYRIESDKGTDICAELNTLAFSNRWILREIQPKEMSLEEIFFKVVSKERDI